MHKLLGEKKSKQLIDEVFEILWKINLQTIDQKYKKRLKTQ